jgi:DNA-directed RNA polymerase subunit RPC12/RpoP
MNQKQYKCSCGSDVFTTDTRTLQKGYVIMTCYNCERKYVRKLKPETCFSCKKEYYALDINTPSGCPHCHRSFVE